MRGLALFFCVLLDFGVKAPAGWAASLPDVFKTVKNSVVVVRTEQTELAPGNRGGLVSRDGLGSGILISGEGSVLTAAHVVQAADRVTVEFADGEEIGAEVVSSEPAADVALLRLKAPPPAMVSAAKLGDSDTIQVGEQIFVVGAPLGISHTLTVGHISARRVQHLFYSGLQMEMFQTDAAINKGNSGGPLFNMSGEVMGVVSHMVSHSGGYEGLGFVVTSNMARRLLLERKSFWSGLESYIVEGEMARIFNIPQPAGLLVQKVAAGSPADLIGMRAGTAQAVIGEHRMLVGGDIILEVQGVQLQVDGESRKEMLRRLVELEPGDIITAKVLRGGQVLELRTMKLP